jgi:hypothetical protein
MLDCLLSWPVVRFHRRHAVEHIADVIARTCPCGGDPTGPMHEESLLHRTWLLGKGLANHDPLADEDRRGLVAKIPPSENHRFSLDRETGA